MSVTKNQPLIFIDTNIFLDFYRTEGEAGLSLLERIDSLHRHLITTDQVEIEFLSNRQKVISDALRSLKTPPPQIVTPAYLSESKTAASIDQHLKSIRRKISVLRGRFQKILKKPSAYDPVYKLTMRIFDDKNVLNLRWNIAAQSEVMQAARDRFARGYAPRKRSDTSMGDAINWEWTLRCSQSTNRDIIIVSRDGDYGLRMDNDHYLNDWLVQEFKSRIGGRRKIEFTTSLSQAFKRLSVPVTPEEEQEEAKLIAKSAPPSSALEETWTKLLEQIGRTNAFIRTYLIDAVPLTLTNDEFIIGFPPEFTDQLVLVDNPKVQMLLKTKLKELGCGEVEVRFTLLDTRTQYHSFCNEGE